MAGWVEIVPDVILSSLYLYLLIRLATSNDDYFKTPFFTLFIVTGMCVYSIIAVVAYHIMIQFSYNENLWTVYVMKFAYVLNICGAEGATTGKVYIAVHRYFVIRTKDFSEKNWSRNVIIRLLVPQFLISILLTTPSWLASYIYRNDIIISLATDITLIMKIITTSSYVAYIVVNTIFTILTTRELARLKQMLKDNTGTTRAIVLQQRNMFIIVTVCSVSHFVKALHQLSIAVCSSLGLHDLQISIRLWYPLANGLATHATPICLVLLSRNVRARLLFSRKNSVESTTTSSDVIVG